MRRMWVAGAEMTATVGREGLRLVKEVPLADRKRDVESAWQSVKLWHYLVQGFSERLILERL